MEHTEAIRLKAAERYLLGELNGDLRSQFEEHFFSCAECAEALGAGAVFIDNARELLQPDADPAPARSPLVLPGSPAKQSWFAALFRPAFAAPALVVLLAIVVYQGTVVIPHLKGTASVAAPQTLAKFSLLAQNSRGAEALHITVPSDRPFGLFLDIPPQPHFAFYSCEIEDAAGKPELSLTVSADEARETIEILVPPSRLQPGQHVLVVRGLDSKDASPGPQVVRYPFSLDFLR